MATSDYYGFRISADVGSHPTNDRYISRTWSTGGTLGWTFKYVETVPEEKEWDPKENIK